MVLHGTMQTAQQIREFSEHAFDRFARGGNIVVYPDALYREWNGARRAKMLFRDVKQVDDVGFLRTLAEGISTTLRLGPVPLIALHGTADPLSRFDGGSVSIRGWFPKGDHLSAAGTAAYFARRNGIHASPAFRWLGPEDGVTQGQVCRTDYREPGCPPVTLYTVVGAGHQIPGASRGGRLLFGAPTRAIDAVTVISGSFGLDAGAAHG